MMNAGFLDLPPRSAKPRQRGLTHVLDRGVPTGALADLLPGIAGYVDVWKLGFGTAYLDPSVPDKLALLRRHGVDACVGGTLLEVAWAQGAQAACLDWAAECGFPLVEVSDGTVGMGPADKQRLIAAASQRFTVLAEVGSKDPAAPVSPALWAQQVRADLQAGARWVIAEARESGTVGLYRPDGSVRTEVVDALVAAAGADAIIFEAPHKDQQAWLVRRFGANTNLGNLAPDDVLGAEALRVGLRADTAAVPARSLRVAP